MCLQVRKHLESFNLNWFKDIVCGTGDGAPVMIRFGTLTPFPYLQCMNHGIHLAVMDVLYTKKPLEDDEVTEDGLSDDSDKEDSDMDSEDDERQDESVDYDLSSNAADAVKIMREIVKLFKYSPVRNSVLQAEAIKMIGKELKLKLDLKIRWNSLVTSIERYLRMSEVIRAALEKLDEADKFTDEHLETLKVD